jgi:hypothetical protein
MTTLTTAPVAPLLATLFAAAAASSPSASPFIAGLSVGERARLMNSKTD